MAPLKSITYISEAATIHICDFNGKQLYDATVYHEPGSYIVNQYTLQKNGILWNSLSNGTAMKNVKDISDKILKSNLCVGRDVAKDFESLQLKPNNYYIFDLQTEYKGPVTNQGMVALAPHFDLFILTTSKKTSSRVYIWLQWMQQRR